MNIFNPFFIFWNTVNKYSYGIRASLVQMVLCLRRQQELYRETSLLSLPEKAPERQNKIMTYG